MKNIIYLFVFVLSASSSVDNKILVSNSGEAQGTYYHIKYKSDNGVDYQMQIDSLLLEIDSSVSIYKPYSIISKLNKGEQVQADDIFNAVYFDAVHVYTNTEGFFDCTVSPLVKYWGFYKEKGYDSVEIDSAKVLEILNRIGMRKTSRQDSTVVLQKGVQLDFNAIAQGYSVDLIAEFLEHQGVIDYLIEVGGEIKARGLNADGNIWRVGVDKPSDEIDISSRFQFIMDLENLSMATSGNYRKFYERDGVKYSHTINPNTGFPVQNRLLSVTVVTNSCALADAYATAFMAMGVKNTKQLINKLDDQLDVYLVYTDKNGDWKTYISPRMKKWIKD